MDIRTYLSQGKPLLFDGAMGTYFASLSGRGSERCELANLDLDIGVGEAELKSRLTGSCSIDYGVGELELTLAGTQEDYCITLDKGVGTATLDGVKMTGGAVYGDGETFIGIDGGIGEIRVGFAPLP